MTLTLSSSSASLLLLLLAKEIASQDVVAEPPWNYDPNSPNGPDHWKESYAACGGHSQSPIDITGSQVMFDPLLTDFNYTNYDDSVRSKFQLINTGSSIQIGTRNAGSAISGGGLTASYNLAQLHFHWGEDNHRGSEHLLDGRASPIEIHFVHWSEKYKTFEKALNYSDGVAVIGVFVQVNRSRDSSALGNLTAYFDRIPHPGNAIAVPSFALQSLLPGDRSFFRYQGSLTTPACQESVIWTVFRNPIYLNEKEIAAFRSIYDSAGQKLLHNYRPPQSLNGRVVYSSIPASATPHQSTASATVLSMLTVVMVFAPLYWFC